MTDEPREKRNLEQERLLEKLEKENKRLAQENEELKATLIKSLQDEIAAAEQINAQVDEPLQKAAIAADLAYQAENSAKRVAELAMGASEIVGKVSLSAKSVEEVANKVAASADGATKSTAKVVEMGKEAANVSNQMATGMQQVSNASQQVSMGAQKLAGLSQSAAQSTEALKKVMDEAGVIAKEASAVTDDALKTVQRRQRKRPERTRSHREHQKRHYQSLRSSHLNGQFSRASWANGQLRLRHCRPNKHASIKCSNRSSQSRRSGKGICSRSGRRKRLSGSIKSCGWISHYPGQRHQRGRNADKQHSPEVAGRRC